jgi:hypothetical protein
LRCAIFVAIAANGAHPKDVEDKSLAPSDLVQEHLPFVRRLFLSLLLAPCGTFPSTIEEGLTMRLMMKFTIPVERGNEAARDGTIGQTIENLVKATNAEAAYFTVIDGERAGYIFFEETDQARLPQLNEPMFAALDAAITIVPALTLDDLKRGLSR